MDAVFRKWPDGDVIAMLCGTGESCNPGNVMSYQHIGQHSEASRDLGRNLRLATPAEYAPLRRELESIYKPERINPVSRLYVNARKAKHA